ncbi:uncharacterized protein NKAPD1-like [Argopecten irradians]|uniref:uncharacterized protein NKAPD1-like n=1 Tax=Argopecten irradians TaxID=31199 RepID=UPI0037134F34
MFTATAKTLLKNHIRHADTHNRMVEESEMWACHRKLSKIESESRDDRSRDKRRKEEHKSSRYGQSRHSNPFVGRNDSQASFLYDQRDESESPEDRGGAYMDRLESEKLVSKKEWKAAGQAQNTSDRWDHSGFEKQNHDSLAGKADGEGRWGHSGYKMMYPGDFDSDSSDGRQKKRKQENYPKNLRKIKKYKKQKKKRKKKKDSEDKNKRTEKEQSNEKKSDTVAHKGNSDLLLMQKFNQETRPKKPSKPRMKMRTWDSDSCADSETDDRDRRKRKARRNRSDDSSYDSSSDSDSYSEGERSRHRKRGKVKTRRKRKQKHTSSETSDSDEHYVSSRKRARSSRTESSGDSEEEYSGKSQLKKHYSSRRYTESSDLTGDSDTYRKIKTDRNSGDSTTKKHKKKKKKH